jgi:membrane protease YdiL (CAAX protease family)
MNKKIKLGLTLFALGLLGVLTMLTVTIPLDALPKEALSKISPQAIKYLILINPTFLLLIAVIVGTLLYDKVGLKVPAISALLKIENPEIKFSEQVKSGVLLGLLTGILISVAGAAFKSSVPEELTELADKIKLTPVARFAYGGLTEEILLRFGFMTLMVWVTFRLTRNLRNPTYWTGILLASILFAFGHFPIVYKAVGDPSFTLLTYIFIGNLIAGLFFGWLYWKKGLEAAFIGHIFAHVAMLASEKFSS